MRPWPSTQLRRSEIYTDPAPRSSTASSTTPPSLSCEFPFLFFPGATMHGSRMHGPGELKLYSSLALLCCQVVSFCLREGVGGGRLVTKRLHIHLAASSSYTHTVACPCAWSVKPQLDSALAYVPAAVPSTLWLRWHHEGWGNIAQEQYTM